MARIFRLRMRPGSAMLTATSGEGEAGASAAAGDELVVSEEVAAFLVRQRAAQIIEVIEPDDSDDPTR
jgi:hypothetical protein